MVSFFKILLGPLIARCLQWWTHSFSPAEPPVFGPEDSAKALAAIAAILLLGLGAVLVISLSGRWVRRLIFAKSVRPATEPSLDSHLGKLDWARPEQEVSDPAGSEPGGQSES